MSLEASFFRRSCTEGPDELAEGIGYSWDQWYPVPQGLTVLWPPRREGEQLKGWLVRAQIPKYAPILPFTPYSQFPSNLIPSCHSKWSFGFSLLILSSYVARSWNLMLPRPFQGKSPPARLPSLCGLTRPHACKLQKGHFYSLSFNKCCVLWGSQFSVTRWLPQIHAFASGVSFKSSGSEAPELPMAALGPPDPCSDACSCI